MSRYIDADALIKQLKSSPAYNDYEWAMYADGFIEDIENAPSIDIEPKRGEWKPKNHHTDYCSNCGFEETQWRTADYNFCPSCGARMKGVDDEHTV